MAEDIKRFRLSGYRLKDGTYQTYVNRAKAALNETEGKLNHAGFPMGGRSVELVSTCHNLMIC